MLHTRQHDQPFRQRFGAACGVHVRIDAVRASWTSAAAMSAGASRSFGTWPVETTASATLRPLQAAAITYRIAFSPRAGTTHQGTPPLEFMQPPAALVPRPRLRPCDDCLTASNLASRMPGLGRLAPVRHPNKLTLEPRSAAIGVAVS